MQHAIEPRREFSARWKLVRNVCVANFVFRAHDALRNGRCTGEKRVRNFFCGEPAHLAKRECNLRVLRQREGEIIALLGSSSSQRILHDIRNLLNEVQLLRYLAEKND